MTPIFALTWTVMHPLDADSLLAGATPASLERDQVELIITLLGTDDTFNQTVHLKLRETPAKLRSLAGEG
ncbi:MAG: hypothetical protein ACFCU9_14210 [Cyanophyceae cyanobacterium]